MDTSSDQAVQDSLKAMTAGMTPLEKAEFSTACRVTTSLSARPRDGKAPPPSEAYKPLQGMNAEEIMAAARKTRDPLVRPERAPAPSR